MSRLKYIVLPVVAVMILWTAWFSYSYFFDSSKPAITISGLEENNTYSGDFQFIIRGMDSYKVGNISVWLDGKQIVNKFKINKKDFEYNLPIPGKSLSDGKHILRIEVIDSSYNNNRTNQDIIFYIDNSPLQAAFVKPGAEFKVFQGRTLHLQFQVNKEIKQAQVNILSKKYDCIPESPNSSIYECFIPIPCEETPSEYPFNIQIIDKAGNMINLDSKFQVIPYPFKKQVHLSVPAEKVKLEEELGLKQQLLEDELELLVKKSPKQKLWKGEFYLPMEMPKTTTEFCTRRVSQEKGCYLHKAVDIAGNPRAVVWAPANGIVILKNRYSRAGNTIVIDHGCGIFTLFFHLENFANVNVGDKVKRGNPIGTMGKTGYATGYHLHWEMRINNIEIDPLQWTKCDF